MISMKKLIIEGRYDSIVTELSRKLLTVIKDSFSATRNPKGEFSGQKIHFKQGETVPDIDDDDKFEKIWFEEVENLDIPLDFYLALKVQWIDGLNDLRMGGDAYNDTKRVSDEMPLIEIRFEIDPAEYPRILSEVAMKLRDVLRHEIEHTTQSGWNLKQGKFLPSDKSRREKIASGEVATKQYFLLKKEIPAMLQGLYVKAKKSRMPFKQVVNDYLDIWTQNNTITEPDKEQILKVWRTYLPQLSIRQEL
jgi:hypothetical protein